MNLFKRGKFINFGNFWHKNCFEKNFRLLMDMNEELKNILEKVKVLYFRYGIKSVTMDDVARELGISKKTLYQYVVDKNDLVAKVMDLEIDDNCGSLTHLFNDSLNAIEQLFEAHRFINKAMKEYTPVSDYDLKKYYPDIYRKLHQVRRDQMYTRILENIKKGKAEGLYRADLNEEIIAKLHVSRFENVFDTEIFSNEEKTSYRVFYEFFIYHIRGIANENGIKLLEKIQKEEQKLSYNP
jgi:TetR/AcrR family transcriptional regulator, cholesterol catabolism regulator